MKATEKLIRQNMFSMEDAYSREDESDDRNFYETIRLVNHLDKTALATVEEIIGNLIVENKPVILDLMASWNSHIPSGVTPAKVVGIGLNSYELEHNKSLTEYLIQDLNKNPLLPFDDNSFDVVLNTVSVEYLTQPVYVFNEVARVLKPGGLFLVIFSNRWFPEKVVKIWEIIDEKDRIELVKAYFVDAQIFEEPEVLISMGKPRPKDDKYYQYGIPSDPIFAVYAEKKGGKEKRKKRDEINKNAPLINNEDFQLKKSQIKQTLQCPYCGEKMKKWLVPNDPFIEWNNEYMYICFNDYCPYLVRGWKVMFDQGVLGTSYRLMYDPERECVIPAPVHSLTDLKDCIITE